MEEQQLDHIIHAVAIHHMDHFETDGISGKGLRISNVFQSLELKTQWWKYFSKAKELSSVHSSQEYYICVWLWSENDRFGKDQSRACKRFHREWFSYYNSTDWRCLDFVNM